MSAKAGRKKRGLVQLVQGDSRMSEIIRFGIVGGFATVLQYGIYVVFVDAVKLPATVSTIISYGISFIFNFILSNFFTFHTHPNAMKGLGFLTSHAINMGMQVGLVAVFSPLVGKTLGLLPAMAICIPVNYMLVRFVLTSRYFKSRKEREANKPDTCPPPTMHNQF